MLSRNRPVQPSVDRSHCTQLSNSTGAQGSPCMQICEGWFSEHTAEKGATSWLTTLPIKEHGFYLNKTAFWDAIHMRYRWKPERRSDKCVCGAPFNVEHALTQLVPAAASPSFGTMRSGTWQQTCCHRCGTTTGLNHWNANFVFLLTLYESECHRHWIPRGSDIAARAWLRPVCAFYQVLEAHENSIRESNMKNWNGATAAYDAFLFLKMGL